MKRVLLASMVALGAAIPCAADDGGRVVSDVEAVYHEGIVSFAVVHPEAVSAAVKVYPLDADQPIFDSGPRARTRLSWPAGRDLEGSYRFAVTAWNAEGEVVVSQLATTKTLTTISEISFDAVPGGIVFAGPDEIDLLADVNVGSIPGVRLYEDYNGKGGAIELYDEGGFSRTAYILPTGSTTGGQVRALGPSGAAWLQGEHPLHGNEAALGVFGTSDFYVWAGETGDDSVQMPDDAVSAVEIKDEAGVAAARNNLDQNIPVNTDTVVLERQIYPSTYGYVLATAHLQMKIVRHNAAYGRCRCSISHSDSFDDDYSVGISDLLDYDFQSRIYSLALSRVDTPSTQSSNYYLVCINTDQSDCIASQAQLVLLFVPTAYGDVSSTTESAHKLAE
jgi:hypothetical protein